MTTSCRRVGILLLGAALLFASVHAYDDKEAYGDSGLEYEEEEEEYQPNFQFVEPRKPINTRKETATNRLTIRWKDDMEDDVEEWFEAKDIGLTWLYDLDDNWTVFEAETVKDANFLMSVILDILSGKPGYGLEGGPLGDDDIRKEIRDCIAKIAGSALFRTFAPKPAAVPSECNNPLPDACPKDGLYGLNMIKAPTVWNALPGVVNERPTESVLVIDSGVRPTHQDLVGNLQADLTVQFFGGNPDNVNDPTGHGTHVAGTVFAKWNNGQTSAVGVVGKALGGVCGCGIPGDPNAMDPHCITRCVNYATERNVRVINLSLGGAQANRLEPGDADWDAFSRFCTSGGVAIIAAGNENQNIMEPNNYVYPATLAADLEAIHPRCIINVANVGATGVLAADSNYGQYVKIAAPGEQILSSWNTSDTATKKERGTSMAAPHVTGMATLLFNTFPGVSAARVYDCILSTAKDPVKPNPDVTKARLVNGGIADLKAAYDCVMNKTDCPTRGLPACVKPKSGTPVRACSTDHYCKQLNDEYICQYDWAQEGSLCKNNEADGHGLYAKVEEAELAKLGLSSEVTMSIMRAKREPKRHSYTRKHSKKSHSSDDDDAYEHEQSKRRDTSDDDRKQDNTKSRDSSEDEDVNAHESKHGPTGKKYKSQDKDTYEHNKSEDGDGKKSHDGSEDEDTYEHDSNHRSHSKRKNDKKRKSHNKSHSTYEHNVGGKQKPEYNQNYHDYPTRQLKTCGVCRKHQCVSELREWCKHPNHSNDKTY